MKRPTRRALLDAGAAAAGLGVVLAVWAGRLPASLDFILTRARGGFLILPLARLFQSPAGHAASALLALALMCGSLAFPAAALWLDRKELFRTKAKKTAGKIALFAAGAAALAASARWGVSSAVDVVENAWFAPEGLSPFEPLILFAAAAGFAALLWRAIGGFWDRVFLRKTEIWTVSLIVAALAWDQLGRRFYDAGKRGLAEAASVPATERRGRLVLVLAEDGGKQTAEAHELVLGVPEKTQYSADALAAVEAYEARRSVFRRAALRYLYGGYTLQMDASGLRRVLARGDKDGDVLARALLLDNLSVAPVGDDTKALFADVNDARRLRVGAAGAARLAAAAAHLGLAPAADFWRRVAATGRYAVPAGLLDALPSVEWAQGRIEGRVRAKAGSVRVALYARPNPDAPPSLGPGQLVASAVLGRDGRFRFAALGAGDYFLALAVDSKDEQPPHLRAKGRWGGLRLSARRPRAEADIVLAQSSIE